MRLRLAMLLMVSGPAWAEPSLGDLTTARQQADRWVDACESGLRQCANTADRQKLGRAFYTQVLADYVHGRPVNPQAASNVQLLDTALYQVLPAQLQGGTAEPAGWVRALLRSPTVVVRVVEPDVPEVQIEPENPWIARYAASIRGDATESVALSRWLRSERLQSTALMVLRDAWFQGKLPDDAVLEMVSLAALVGGRMPLIELAQHRSPDTWPVAARSDVRLALGLAYQGRGEVSPALKSYGAIEPESAAYVHGEYQTGQLYRQSGEPWVALRAFQNAWAAEGQTPFDERVRDQAVWQLAELNQSLARPDEAIAQFEVLTIGDTPLVSRAALKSAWVAYHQEDAALALRWLPALPATGVVPAEVHLLRASLAARRSDDVSARRYLEIADDGLRELRSNLDALLRPRQHIDDSVRTESLFAARLSADPVWRAHQDHLQAIIRDQQALRGDAVALPERVRAALIKRLAVRARKVEVSREHQARFVLSRLRDELVSLDRDLAQLTSKVAP